MLSNPHAGITTRNAMRKITLLTLSIWLAVAASACSKTSIKEPIGQPLQAVQGDQDYKYKMTVGVMQVDWLVAENELQIKVKAKTNGWVGIGFNASKGMKDAWFVLGYVKEGKLTVVEDHGTAETAHRPVTDLGGTASVKNASGSNANDETEIRFSMPLQPPGSLDKPIVTDAEMNVLLAYGDSIALQQIHKFRAKLKVNLSSGKYTIVSAN
jgi:DOMON domain